MTECLVIDYLQESTHVNDLKTDKSEQEKCGDQPQIFVQMGITGIGRP